jgi:hypothetical protein
MKKFRSIEIGSAVAIYNRAGSKKIEGSEKPNGSFLARKMYYTNANAVGVVTKIHGHNAHAVRITLDNGKEIEMGLDTHYHLNGEIGECVAHQDKYSLI